MDTVNRLVERAEQLVCVALVGTADSDEMRCRVINAMADRGWTPDLVQWKSETAYSLEGDTEVVRVSALCYWLGETVH